MSDKLAAALAKCAGGDGQCLRDPADGYAILKDLKGETQALLVATDDHPGIEDRSLQTATAPNYFAMAWSARGCVSKLAGAPIPDDALSLAINSAYGRTQGRLHIHIDRLQPALLAWLKDGQDLVFNGDRYRVEKIERLAGVNLFQKVAKASGTADISLNTIVVVGAPGGGFFLLTSRAECPRNLGNGEELQVDHPTLSTERFATLRQQASGCAP